MARRLPAFAIGSTIFLLAYLSTRSLWTSSAYHGKVDPYYAHYDQEFEMDGVCVRDLVMRDRLKDMESSLLKKNIRRIEVEII